MSTLRLLISDLAARPDSSLLRLLSLRPELMDPPAADFAALAARASSRAGLSRALDRLNQPQLQVLTALVVTAGPESGATAEQLADAVGGATPGDVEALLAELHGLALVLPTPRGTDDAGRRLFLPVTSLREVLGAHPAGLGRSYAELADSLPGCRDRLAGIAAALQLPGTTAGPAAALHRHLCSYTDPARLLAGAPDGTAELLAKFGAGPLGRVGHALRDPGGPDSPGDPGEGGGAVNWLLGHGLLVPVDDDHVELPREVGLLLRHGKVVARFAPEPPGTPVAQVRTALRDNAALGAVAAVLRTMGRLLDSVEGAPLATLRAGGVGVRAVRALARDLEIEMAQSYFYLELAAMAKLITLDPDTSLWKATASGWRPRDRAEQWLWLASAWLDAARLPSLVGTGSPAVNVLAGEAHRADAPALRATSLQVLATLHRGTAANAPTAPTEQQAPAQPGMVPAPTPEQVLEHYAWHHPRPARRIARALAGFLAEAEILGLTGASALTELGLAVIERDWDGALDLLAAALPDPVEHVLLQGDLTAVAPGYLSPALSAELSLLAEPEGRGTAGVYRFTPASIRRALAAGRTGAGIMEFLAAHSATSVPQPLAYLIADADSRHGRFTLGAASAVVSTEDPALMAELLAGDRAARLQLTAVSPTVAVSALAPADLAREMLDAGHSPSLSGDLAAAEPDRPAGRAWRAAPAVPHQALAPYEAARLLAAEYGTDAGRTDDAPDAGDPAAQTPAAETPGDGAAAAQRREAGNGVGHPRGAAEAQLAVLRSRPAWTPGRGEAAPALVREQLQRAIRDRADVWLTTVSGEGRPERLRVHPSTVAEGRVRAFDPGRDSERVFSLHRVMDVELIEGTGTKGRA
ncbi:helicase-associated domain-containing protein [Arthrobacter sp. STN4]|uniref:helicase-associated domain-containing protein n=1 Tax=Arthrobacter sp. STN4 TaxID=2923276 RepID=UPI00211A5655|nr:helicase-associated domain-containing protein [Arthrobacter sp. STN4]MCQ9165774.1 helicase C-terminal domain-containing protein [Arthrobacter sp. STN4]